MDIVNARTKLVSKMDLKQRNFECVDNSKTTQREIFKHYSSALFLLREDGEERKENRTPSGQEVLVVPKPVPTSLSRQLFGNLTRKRINLAQEWCKDEM